MYRQRAIERQCFDLYIRRCIDDSGAGRIQPKDNIRNGVFSRHMCNGYLSVLNVLARSAEVVSNNER